MYVATTLILNLVYMYIKANLNNGLTLFQWGSKVSTNWSNTWKHACYCAFMYTSTEKHIFPCNFVLTFDPTGKGSIVTHSGLLKPIWRSHSIKMKFVLCLFSFLKVLVLFSSLTHSDKTSCYYKQSRQHCGCSVCNVTGSQIQLQLPPACRGSIYTVNPLYPDFQAHFNWNKEIWALTPSN